MKVEELRGLSSEELIKQQEAARKELFDLRFRLATRQLVNIRQIRQVKKTIAQLNTVLRERELGIR
jgi:large subunit ribosomal protein L29